jgi:hypothetical protein
MALIQIVELQTEQGPITLKNEANTLQATSDQQKLHDHRSLGGLGSLSIGHYSLSNNFVVPLNT